MLPFCIWKELEMPWKPCVRKISEKFWINFMNFVLLSSFYIVYLEHVFVCSPEMLFLKSCFEKGPQILQENTCDGGLASKVSGPQVGPFKLTFWRCSVVFIVNIEGLQLYQKKTPLHVFPSFLEDFSDIFLKVSKLFYFCTPQPHSIEKWGPKNPLNSPYFVVSNI